MLTWQGEIDHSLLKRQVLEQWRAREIDRNSICDAGARLVSAARFHGRRAKGQCPICRNDDLRLVFWVFGENLGRRAGSACSEAELSAIVREYGACTVKEVEVCPVCKWSFLARTLQAAGEESEEQGEHP